MIASSESGNAVFSRVARAARIKVAAGQRQNRQSMMATNT